MSTRRRIASGLLVVAGGCAVNALFAAAFVPPAATAADGRAGPTPNFYTNGDAPLPPPVADLLESDRPSPLAPAPRRLQPRPPQEASPSPDPLETWGRLRLGLGSGPGSSASVYWVGEGALYEAYSGKILAIFEGFDVARGVDLGDGRVRQVSRKVFWYRDPDTGEVLTEFEGRPVTPIKYDSQVIDYFRNDDGSVGYSVESSKRPLKGALPPAKITSRMMGPHQMCVNAPVFVDIPGYQAWEFYDFQCDPSFPSDRPPTCAWTRQGPAPPFDADGAQTMMKFAGYRADRYEDLPERMREEVERACPLFREPPRDEEVGALQ